MCLTVLVIQIFGYICKQRRISSLKFTFSVVYLKQSILIKTDQVHDHRFVLTTPLAKVQWLISQRDVSKLQIIVTLCIMWRYKQQNGGKKVHMQEYRNVQNLIILRHKQLSLTLQICCIDIFLEYDNR